MNYKVRADGRSSCLLDARLERQFPPLTAGIDGTNLLNSRYQEVVGIDLPRRRFMLTFRTR